LAFITRVLSVRLLVAANLGKISIRSTTQHERYRYLKHLVFWFQLIVNGLSQGLICQSYRFFISCIAL
jgi:hypothetical protein